MTRGRETVHLEVPPEDPRELRGFPRTVLTPEQDLWRVGRKGRGPWWFGSSGGRFDLPEPEGTCYLATDELSALLEAVGPDRQGGAISTRFLSDRRFRRLRIPRQRSLADLTAQRGAGFGVTLEINTVVPYHRPRAWARCLRRSGAGGLRYLARHDPAAGRCVALFGAHGERTSWRRGREGSIGHELVERFQEATGIAVIGVPRLNELRLVEPVSPAAGGR